MSNEQPSVRSGSTVFRVPTGREQVARRAQRQALTLGIGVGAALVALATWALVASAASGREVDADTARPAVLFIVIGLALLVAMVTAVAMWRRNLRQAVGDDGVVFAVDEQRLALGAFGALDWTTVRTVEFRDRRPGDGTFRGTPAAYGRALGHQLRTRGGKSELDVLVSLDDAELLRLPFGAALPAEAFHDAYRATEAVAVARGVAIRYNAASV